MALSLVILSGCGGMSNPFSSDSGNSAEAAAPDYYYGEFSDVPVPSSMKKDGEATTIQPAAGVKSGGQSFKGRVELSSLNDFMINAMTREGWSFQAAFRSTKSVLVFEKNDKYCIIYTTDGPINTGMHVVVAPKVASSGSILAPAGSSSIGGASYSNPITE